MGQNSAETLFLAIASGLNSLRSILLAGWTDFQPESSDGELFYAFFYQNRFQLLLGSWLAGWMLGTRAGLIGVLTYVQ